MNISRCVSPMHLQHKNRRYGFGAMRREVNCSARSRQPAHGWILVRSLCLRSFVMNSRSSLPYGNREAGSKLFGM